MGEIITKMTEKYAKN